MTGKVSISSNGVSEFRLCSFYLWLDYLCYRLCQVRRFELDLCGLCQFAQSSSSQVCEKRLRVHVDGAGRVRLGQIDTHQQSFSHRFVRRSTSRLDKLQRRKHQEDSENRSVHGRNRRTWCQTTSYDC